MGGSAVVSRHKRGWVQSLNGELFFIAVAAAAVVVVVVVVVVFGVECYVDAYSIRECKKQIGRMNAKFKRYPIAHQPPRRRGYFGCARPLWEKKRNLMKQSQRVGHLES